MATILITGCSSGFGNLATRELSAAGHSVVASMRDPLGRNQKAARELAELSGVRVLELDVTQDDSVSKAAELAGDVDAVIHNAGLGITGVAEGSTTEQLSYIMEVNLIGVHRLNRAVLPGMRARKSGLLIYVSSGLGRTVLPYMSAYCASKYALEAYAETLSYELSTHGIDTVILQPGAYPSGFRGNILKPDDQDRLADYPVEQAEAESIHRNISEMLQSEMAPDPHDVTRAMLKVIEMPRTERPLRVALRKDSGGLKMINQICGEVQGALLRGMNLEHRLPKRPQL
ncbi:MAG: SDR family oxidoreductase [Calditrichaeota bacterium]|nr:SDR family oxidoreductase [Calditrichota bacterium]MCB9369497.1 SDR family oxidoreductase [Calditrichota bacterium]